MNWPYILYVLLYGCDFILMHILDSMRDLGWARDRSWESSGAAKTSKKSNTHFVKFDFCFHFLRRINMPEARLAGNPDLIE